MDINVLLLIIIITSLVSIGALRDRNLLSRYLFIPSRVFEFGERYRFFSHMFIHADYGHLIFNMLSLYFLGNVMLTSYGGDYVDNSGAIFHLSSGWIQHYGFWQGQFLFVILYFFGGLFASLLPYSRNKTNPSYMSLGASGAVSAVIFASIIWNPTLKLYLFFIPFGIPAYVFGPLYIAYEIYMDRRGGSTIAHDAHLGGAIFGIIFVLLINFEAGIRFVKQILQLF